MWKILTVQIMEKIYYSLVSPQMYPEEQKGCNKRTRTTSHLLYIHLFFLKENNVEKLAKVKIHRGVFQWDVLSLLLFLNSKDSVHVSIRRLEDCIKNAKKDQLQWPETPPTT